MAFIKIISEEDAEGRLKEIYEDISKKRGKLANVHMAQSLNPESIVHHMDLYIHLLYGKSPLKRYQREMIATIVSVATGCGYCQAHHGAALNHFWKNETKIAQLKADYTKLSLSKADELLCDYAWTLTKKPEKTKKESLFVAPLKEQGFSDLAILDATLIISYFNFVNRIMNGLGVELEGDQGKGYNYD